MTTIKHRVFSSIAALIVIIGFFAYESSVFAATYTFTQSSWTGGVDGTTVAAHPGNESNWIKYNSASGITAGATLSLPSVNYTFSDGTATSTTPVASTTGGGFGNGTNSQTAVVTGTVALGKTGVATPMVAAGQYTGYALKSDGTVWAWGSNAQGQLGLNDSGQVSQTTIPMQVPVTGVTAIAASGLDIYVLKSDGTVWASGYNSQGQLGNNSTTQSRSLVQVSGLTGVTAIAAGGYGGGGASGYALKSDGTVWAWGDNSNGEIGNNSTVNALVPVQVSGLTGMTAIAAGYHTGYALKSDGTVWAWGRNDLGQLGNNSTTESHVPVQAANLTNVTAIASAGGSFTGYALTSDGKLWAWGNNGDYEFGNNTNANSSVPIQTGLSSVALIAANYTGTYVVKSDGTEWAWGYNSNGQVGNNSTTNATAPVQVSGLTGVVSIAGGNISSYAIKSDGTVWAWGGNANGQLGNTSTTDSHVPIKVFSPTPTGAFIAQTAQATSTADGGSTTFVLKADGTVWAWGYGGDGEMGNGSNASSKLPQQVPGLSAIALGASNGSGYVRKSDTTLWSWGYGSYGQLGNGGAVSQSSPVQVSNLTGANPSASRFYSGYALKSDGTAWAYGNNANGQLGNGTTTQSTVPVQVTGLTNVIYVTGSSNDGYALKSDGTVWAWGYGGYGGLGNNATTDSLVPVQVSNLTGITSIAASNSSGYALKSDGTVWAWGLNSNGQLGNNSTAQSSVPVQVANLTGVIAIAGGGTSGYAVKSDGTVWAWGQNTYGQLGNNSTAQSLVPVQVSGLTGAIAVYGGDSFASVVKSDGTMWDWGQNTYGQLGNNTLTDSHVPVQVLVYQASDVLNAGTVSYYSSGTFTSAAINLGSPVSFSTISYTATLNGQTITMKARSSATADFSGAPAWGTCTNITSGSALSTGGCVTNGQQYVQYQLSLSTANTSVTPTLSAVSIGFSTYSTSGNLTSSVYDTGDSHNLIARISWAETATTTADNIKFQIRSSPDNVTWSAWCGYADCSGSTYFSDGAGNGQDMANNHPLRTGNDDRYIQYKVFMASDGAGSPILNNVAIKYVINAPPDFDPTYGTNGVTVSQVATSTDPNWGKVAISYSVRDIDTNTGTITPGLVTPSFEYSTDNGSTWLPIPSGDLRAGDTSNKAVDTTIYTTYSAVWTATSTAPNLSSSTVKVRVTANDNEAANNTGTAVSSTISLDTKAPTATLSLDASTGGSTGTLTLTTSDTSQSQYRICNDPAYPATDAQGNSCAWTALGTGTTTQITWTPNKGGDGTETVYAQARDAYGNTTPVTVVAPASPANFDLKDVSNPSINAYKEFLSWAPFTATSSVSFASYKVYHSTDGTTFTLLTTITDPTLNYYADTVTVSTSSMQYYKVETTSTQGNVSPFTVVLSDVPNGQGGTDTTPPVIDPASIVIPGTNITNSSAVVTFTTDELSQGTVQFRQNGTTPWTTVTNQSYVLAHNVYIQGLSPNTTYNVQVSAKDVAGNVSTYVAGPNFTTSGGPVITNITESSITDAGATIVWNTSTSSDSYVTYSTNQNLSSPTTAGSGTQVSCAGALCEHKVTLTSLTAGVTYYFYVSSTDGAGNKSTDTNGGAYYTFHTSVDTTPPTISAISEPVVSMTSAVIVWTTDEPATTQVTWGTASGQLTRSTVADLTKSVYHIVTLSSETKDTGGSSQALTAITPYYFKVNSIDAAGNAAASPEQTFTTADAGTVRVITQFTTTPTGTGTPADTTPPSISAVSVDNIGAFNADVHVTTSKDTTTFVSYGPTTDYGSIEGNDQLQSTKTITLKHLQEGTTYHLRVKVTDQYGTAVAGSDQTFSTIYSAQELANLTSLDKATQLQDKLEELIQSSLPSLAPPFITEPEVSNITESSATISWKTNIKSYGSLRYATDAEFTAGSATDLTASSTAYKTEVSDGNAETATHSVDLANLEPNTLYHVQARAYVFPQVVGASDDVTFTTHAAAIVPNIVDVKNDGFTVVWQTDAPTSSTVTYKNLTTGERAIITDESLKTYHNVQIQNLPSGTPYVVSVSGTTKDGNTLSSVGNVSVTTSVDLTPPVISNFKVDNALIPGRADLIQTVVGWQTDKPANSAVFYQEGNVSASATSTELKNKVQSLDSYTTAHILIIPSLKPGSVYSLKVVSVDQSGNTKVFGPTSIITPRQTQSVLDIIVKNFEDTFKFLGAGK